MRVQSSKMRVFSVDRYEVPHWLYIIEICTASRGFPATARLLLTDLINNNISTVGLGLY